MRFVQNEGMSPRALDQVEAGAVVLPLAIAGRVAVHGILLFDDDPPARVRWQADTRQQWSDEAHRRAIITADILTGAAGG